MAFMNFSIIVSPPFYKDETDFSLIEEKFSGGESSGLGFPGSCFRFFHASTAARLVKKAHDSQDRSCDDDDPFSPCGWPPKYGQNNHGHSQQEPTEAEFHEFPPSLLRLTNFIKKYDAIARLKYDLVQDRRPNTTIS